MAKVLYTQFCKGPITPIYSYLSLYPSIREVCVKQESGFGVLLDSLVPSSGRWRAGVGPVFWVSTKLHTKGTLTYKTRGSL